MDRVFDRIVIAVPSLKAATADYECLLGAPGARTGTVARWILDNTTIELEERQSPAASVAGIVMTDAQATAQDQVQENSLGIDVRVCDGSATRALREAGVPSSDLQVDHLVLRTADAQGTITLFRDALGVRLALDKTAPQWGGRMLFFRGGKMTLEVIVPDEDDGKGSYFWGIAYQCADIDATARSLADRGVALSPVRDGRKPGTRVATVKSHTLEIPTLLIEPAQTS